MYATEILPSETYSDSLANEQRTDLKRDSQKDPFDPRLFRRNAEIAISRLEEYLADPSIKGLALTDPSELLATTRNLMNSAGPPDEKLGAIIDLYIKTGIQVHSPGYMGRQFSGVVPLAGIFDFISSTVNQPSSFYEAAQLPNVVERIMAQQLNRFIGWDPDQFSMVTTSGGSLANLTALLAARNDKLPQVWSKGLSALDVPLLPAVAMSEDVHYSVSRAVGILGLGEDQIVRLPINRKRQIRTEEVRPALKAAEARGLKVFCLVASAGTTSVGAFDPIDKLAEICHENGIWFHIDGAHGASFMVSDRLRDKLKGFEKADSFLCDAHKTLFVPAMCTLLFYKNKEKGQGAFRQNASYVFEKKPDVYTAFDSAERNLECTKRPMIMNLWILWVMYGREFFAKKLEYLCTLTENAFRIVQNEPDFEALHRPEANIFCFRYQPPNLDEGAFTDFQVAIRNRIKEDGRFFISKVDIEGKGSLRVVFMNHEINEGHFRLLLSEIKKTGQELLLRSQG